MRRILLAAISFVALGSSAQTPMSQVLKQMPDSIVPYLSENNKLDMIDFLDSKMKAEVHNLLDGKTELLTLTECSAVLQLNEASHLDIRLLDVAEPVDSASQIVCLISTYGAGVRESRVAFYSVCWRKLPTTQYVTLPDEMFTATFSDDEQQPVLTLRMAHPLDYPATDEQKPLQESLTNLKWNGKTFNKD
jgi:hypothetical protein